MTEIITTRPLAPSPAHLLKQLQVEFKVLGEYLPLASGIDKQVLNARPGINLRQLRAALAIHTHSVRYLKSMQTATMRFNLDGTAIGEVSEEQRAWASKDLIERFKKRHQRHKITPVTINEAEENPRAERERLKKLHQLVSKFFPQMGVLS